MELFLTLKLYLHLAELFLAEWSRCRKLTLNTSKCEVAFFTNNSKEARWQSSVQLDGTQCLPSHNVHVGAIYKIVDN